MSRNRRTAGCDHRRTATATGVLRATAAYDGHSSMIPAARDFTDDFLTRVCDGSVLITQRQREAARLVVGELVTNAAVHAPGPCWLGLSLDRNVLEISVTDTSPARPVPQPREPARVGQHGLEIVLALCQSLEGEPTPLGKTIRAALLLG